MIESACSECPVCHKRALPLFTPLATAVAWGGDGYRGWAGINSAFAFRSVWSGVAPGGKIVRVMFLFSKKRKEGSAVSSPGGFPLEGLPNVNCTSTGPCNQYRGLHPTVFPQP